MMSARSTVISSGDGHDCCGGGSEMVRKMWGITNDLGRDCHIFHLVKLHKRGPYLEDNCLQDNVIKKTFVGI